MCLNLQLGTRLSVDVMFRGRFINLTRLLCRTSTFAELGTYIYDDNYTLHNSCEVIGRVCTQASSGSTAESIHRADALSWKSTLFSICNIVQNAAVCGFG